MAQFVINGGKKLKGEIRVSGAKNAALKAFAAALLTKEPVLIKNVPEVEDVSRMAELIKTLGPKVEHIRRGEYRVTADKLNSSEIEPEIGKKYCSKEL